jgi:ADP-heptose:LPS heptosyltransferase
MLKALYRSYPKSHIELLVASQLSEEVYSCAEEVSDVVLIDFNRSNPILKVTYLLPFLLNSYLKGSFDICFLSAGLYPRIGRLLKYTGAVKELVYTPFPKKSGLTDLECNVNLARAIDETVGKNDVFIPINSEAELEAEKILIQHNISLKKEKILAVYPSSELKHRPRWQIQKLLEVIRKLKNNGINFKVIAIGSKKEGEECKDIDQDGIIDANLAGDLSILGTAALLSKCFLAVANDGGLMHVAGAVGCPLVAIMPNTPLSYRPPGKKVKTIHSTHTCCQGLFPNRPKDCNIAKCIEDISIEDVFNACKSTLRDLNGINSI